MIFKNIHEKSYLPKMFIAAAILGSIYVSGYLMFTSSEASSPTPQRSSNCVRTAGSRSEGENCAAVDLFGKPHARRVLAD